MLDQIRTIILSNQDLLPRSERNSIPAWVFNPTLLKIEAGFLLVYRVVKNDGRRKLYSCLLDEDLEVREGTQRCLSDQITFDQSRGFSTEDRTWFADPRLMRLDGKVLLYWNSGWHAGQNAQFLVRINPHDQSPKGSAQELLLVGQRQTIEKNWTLFFQDMLYCVYSPTPHVILKGELTAEGPIKLHHAHSMHVNSSIGELRGGAAPVLVDGIFYSVVHAVLGSAEGRRTVTAMYTFDSQAPFRVLKVPKKEIPLYNPFGASTILPKLHQKAGEAAYPCGAAKDGAAWVIAYGINNERCAIASIPESIIEDTLIEMSEMHQ